MGAGKGKSRRVLAKAPEPAKAAVKRNYVDETSWWEPDDFTREVEAVQLSRLLNIHPVTATRVLKEKLPRYSDYQKFLSPTKSLLRTPEATVEGMDAAGELVAEKIKAGERIAIFGDYDPDGTTGVAALTSALRYYDADGEDKLTLGFASASEGFGLTENFVKKAHDEGATLLISADCGSTQIEAMQLAKDLGMQTIVVDHHDYDPSNPTDFHLNPKKHAEERGEDDPNTGAQLAWKLGASVQVAMEGETRPEYWKTPMFLAGMGCRADMAPLNNMENRAFFRVPLKDKNLEIPPGLQHLLDYFEEDIKYSSMIRTNACLNMPKRTVHANAADVAKLLCCDDPKKGKEYADNLIAVYEDAVKVKDAMGEKVQGQVAKRRDKDQYFATGVIKDQPDYAGYTGVVATKIAREERKPACIFALRGEDEFGQKMYKFSLRNGVLDGIRIGEDVKGYAGKVRHSGLIHDNDMARATTFKQRNAIGEVIETNSIGGHADVVSGACTEDRIPEVRKALDKWAEERTKIVHKDWRPKEKGRVYLTARRVPAEDLPRIEEEAKLLQPYGQHNYPTKISMEGRIRNVALDEESGKYKGELVLENKEVRKVVVHEPNLVEKIERNGDVTNKLEVCFAISGLDDEEYWITAWKNASAGDPQSADK